jgi:AsmA-like C-terminal region
MTVFEVPKGIDFTFKCSIANVIYDNLNLKDLLGEVVLANQQVRFNNLTFNTLGGNMRLAGGYGTQNPASPDIDLTMSLVGLDVQQTWKAFEIVKNLAPAAKFLDGKVNSSLNLVGKLKTDMSPDLASITSVGDLVVNQGTLRGFKPMETIGDKIKLAQLKELKLKDTKILYEIKQGRIWVEPFDVAIGNGKMVSKGSHGIDQTMDYDMDFDIPAGVAGTAAMTAVNGLLKNVPGVGGGNPSGNLRVAVGLGGTVDKPTIKYVRPGGQGGTEATIVDVVNVVKDSVKTTIINKVEDIKEDVSAKLRAEADKILADAQAVADKTKAEAKTAADKVRAEANKRADDIEKSAKNPLEKVAKKKAADLVRKEGKEGGDKLEKEATAKADKIMAEARSKSDAKLNGK